MVKNTKPIIFLSILLEKHQLQHQMGGPQKSAAIRTK